MRWSKRSPKQPLSLSLSYLLMCFINHDYFTSFNNRNWISIICYVFWPLGRTLRRKRYFQFVLKSFSAYWFFFTFTFPTFCNLQLVSSRISSITDLPLRRKFNIPVEEAFLHRASARGPGRGIHTNFQIYKFQSFPTSLNPIHRGAQGNTVPHLRPSPLWPLIAWDVTLCCQIEH